MFSSELLNIIVENNIIDKEMILSLMKEIYEKKLDNTAGAPWDLFFFEEWKKDHRNDFVSISNFYKSDAHVVFQASMMQSWENCTLPDILKKYINSNTKVLEYGSGSGREVFSALRAGAEVTACDVSEKLLLATSLLAQKYGKSIETVLIEDEVPSFSSEFYDIVVTIDCLEHVQKPIEILVELVKSLKPNGYFYNEVFFDGHELSPYHLVETRYLGQQGNWHSILKQNNLKQIDSLGNLWQKK